MYLSTQSDAHRCSSKFHRISIQTYTTGNMTRPGIARVLWRRGFLAWLIVGLKRDRLGKGSFPLTARERRALGGPGRSALGIAGPLCPSRPSARVLAVFGR